MRWAFYNRLKELYPDVHMTFGYITKNKRIELGLPKEHYIDARCISDYPEANHAWGKTVVYYQKKVRCHNRQIHKMSILKDGVRKYNQAPKYVKGYRLFDAVKAKGKEWYIHGRRLKGSFVLKNIKGDTLEIAPSKISLMYRQNQFTCSQFTALLS